MNEIPFVLPCENCHFFPWRWWGWGQHDLGNSVSPSTLLHLLASALRQGLSSRSETLYFWLKVVRTAACFSRPCVITWAPSCQSKLPGSGSWPNLWPVSCLNEIQRLGTEARPIVQTGSKACFFNCYFLAARAIYHENSLLRDALDLPSLNVLTSRFIVLNKCLAGICRCDTGVAGDSVVGPFDLQIYEPMEIKSALRNAFGSSELPHGCPRPVL